MQQIAEQTERFVIVCWGELRGVPKADLLEVWPLVGSMIADAINRNHGDLGLAEVFDRLQNDKMQLWAHVVNGSITACCVTQIENRASGRTCVLYYVAGKDMKMWLPLDSFLGNWAKGHGCVALECVGRKGWERVLKDWDKVAIVMRKEL